MDIIMKKPSKKRNCTLEEDKQRNRTSSLPTEIAFDIFLRLSITSLVQSSFVCRSWQNLSRDRNLVSLHLSQAVKHDPLLIFHSDFPIRNQLCFADFFGADNDVKGVVKKINIPFSAAMPEFTVVGSCNGLLCLCDSLYKDAVYIYNPLTNDYKALPKTRQYDKELVVCGFGYHSEIKQYKVVKIVYHWIVNIGDHPVRRIRRKPRTSKSDVLVLSLGSNTWKNIGQVPYYVDRRSQGALFTCGRIHWLTRGVYNNVCGLIIVSFDLADEKFHEVSRPDFSSLRDCRNYQLTSLRGCLSAVTFKHFLSRDVEVWVMKEYNVKESWLIEFKIRGNIPKSPFTKLPPPLRIWSNSCNTAFLRVLYIIGNGEILIEYEIGKLALYDAVTEKFKIITFKGLPSIFKTFVHLGSLNQIDLPVNL